MNCPKHNTDYRLLCKECRDAKKALVITEDTGNILCCKECKEAIGLVFVKKESGRELKQYFLDRHANCNQ